MRRLAWLGFLSVVLSLFRVSPITAEDAGWKAGLARVEITPEQPLFMAGYASRDKPSEGVLSDLYAKVLVLEDGNGRRAVLVTADLIGFRAEFAEPICETIQQQHELRREDILLNASHTHTGPTPMWEARVSGPLTEADAQKQVAYTRGLQDKIASAVSRAFSQLEPVTLSWGIGVAEFVMNRREHTPNGVILGVNPSGPVDRSVPVLRVAVTDGALRGVVFGAACHNTTLTGEHYRISGDYAGFAQDFVEGEHPAVQAMFVAGCGGDANPYPRGKVKHARRHGELLGREVNRLLGTELRPVRGPLRTTFDYADLPLQRPGTRVEIEEMARNRGWQGFLGREMLQVLDRGEELPSHYRAPIALWQFGSDLTLVGLSGEVVVDYVSLLQEVLGPLNLWVAGYCNDVFGYLPSVRVLREGGYETRGLYYGGIGQFAPDAQDVVTETVRRLAEEAGRE